MHMRISLTGIVYFIVGVLIAGHHHYFTHVDKLNLIFSAVLAVVLWPLILFGINLHVR
jgi:hypothetical protein